MSAHTNLLQLTEKPLGVGHPSPLLLVLVLLPMDKNLHLRKWTHPTTRPNS
jgi:hypothetical protein